MNTLVLLCALLFAPPTPPAKPAAKPAVPPVLQGTVQGPDTKPIDKALVLVRPVTARMGEPALTTRTDATGAFRVALPVPGLVSVRVEAPGLAPRSFDRLSPGTPLVVTLAKGKSMEGVVRDGASTQPVAGAQVEARPVSGTWGAPWEAEAGVVAAVTDKKGAFRLDGLPAETQTVSAGARGYGRATRQSVLPGSRVELFLFPGASLRGVVKGPQNQPLPGVVVRLEGGARSFFGARLASRTTDAAGRFEFLGVEPGTYQLLAHHKDWALGVLGDIVVERLRDTEVDVRLEPGKRVTGRLVDADQRPLPGRVVFEELAGEGPLRSAAALLRAETDADGRFTVERLPTGDHALSADARGFSAKRVDVQVRARDKEVALGDIVLEPGAIIRGRVRDKAGLGVGSARIFSLPAGGMRVGVAVESLSEADGTFVLAGLQAGSYRLQVSAPGYGGGSATAVTGSEKVEIVLEPAGSITGLVVDEAGRTVDSFEVVANPTRREPGGFMNRSRGDGSSGDGRFSLLDLPAGEYVVEVTAPEMGRGVVSGVKVSAGGTTDAGRVTIKAGGVVRGQVVDASGVAVPGATVSAGDGPGFGPRLDRGTGNSDASGNFEIRGVTPGLTTLTATHPNYAMGQVTGVEVDPARPA
jgi:hypothetical protein